MRGLFLALGAAVVLMMASADAAAANPAANPVAANPVADSLSQIDALQQRLLASQQTIATLQRELADAQTRSVALEQCRTKNGRLVSIGRQLIEGYERRYRAEKHHDPLQLGRRRFEFELQALTDLVYDNHADVPVKLPAAVQPQNPEPTAAKPADTAAPAIKGKGK